MRRAFIEVHALVSILLVLVVFLVLLSFTGIYGRIIKSFGEDTFCETSFIASAMTKAFGKQAIDPQCKTRRITITLDKEGDTENGGILIPLNYPKNYDKIQTFNEDNKENEDVLYSYSDEAQEEENKPSGDEAKEYVSQRYNMDKVVADEMKRCWDVVGQGKLDLFDNWFSFIDCNTNEPGIQGCPDIFQASLRLTGDFVSHIPLAGELLEKLGYEESSRASANFCVLCARIKFDEKVSESFKGTVLLEDGLLGYDSINRWMANNPWRPLEKESYYEYLLSDAQKKEFFAQPIFEYSTEKPYAVVFIRVNFFGAAVNLQDIVSAGEDVLDFLTPDASGPDNEEELAVYHTDTMSLIPYADLPTKCDYIVGSYI